MATIQSMTKDRLLVIENSSIISGNIDEAGHLILQTRGGDTIDAGYVIGPRGEVIYGTLGGTYLDLVGGRPRVLLDGLPLPLAMDYTLVDPLDLKTNARVIVLRLDDFYVLVGQLNGTVPPKPNRVTGIDVILNEGIWLEGFIPQTRVVLEWNGILEDENGNDADIMEYQIFSKVPGGILEFDGAVDGSADVNNRLSKLITHWEPGKVRRVVIFGRSSRGGMSDPSVEKEVIPVMPPSNIPAEPENLRLVSNIGYFGPGGAMSRITVAFDRVSVSTDGGPITVGDYELYIDAYPVERSRSLEFTFDIVSGRTVTVQTMAYSIANLAGGASLPLEITGAIPDVDEFNPSDPILSSGYGNTVVRWDGLGDVEVPDSFDRLEVIVTNDDAIPPIVQTDNMREATSRTFLLGEKGTTNTAYFVARDKLGRYMGESGESSVTVVGIQIPDVDDDITELLEELEQKTDAAQKTADGNSANVRSPSPPHELPDYTPKTNDMWWMYDGPLLKGLWMYSENEWVPQGFANEVIGNLDAGKVTTGILDANRIGAKTITVEKLILAGFTNFFPDPNFELENAYTPWVSTEAGVLTKTNHSSVLPGAYFEQVAIDVKPDENYYISFGTLMTGATPPVGEEEEPFQNIKLWIRAETPLPPSEDPEAPTATTEDFLIGELNLTSALSSGTLSGSFQVPEGVTKIWPGVFTEPNSESGILFYLMRPNIKEQFGAEVLVDGSVTAKKLQADQAFLDELFVNEANAGRILVDYLEPNAGETLNLRANEAIILMVQQQEDAESAISDLTEAVQSADEKAEQGISDAANALGAAEVADAKAYAAEVEALLAREAASRLDAYVQITEDGLGVYAKEESSSYVFISPDRVSITSQGDTASWWEASLFTSSKIFTEEITIGTNHIIERGTNRTFIREL